MSEFIDNEAFSNLESVLVQQCVKECLVEDGKSFELNSVKKLLERCDIVCTEIKKQNFKTTDILQDLRRLLDEDVVIQGLSEWDLKVALGAVASLIKYLGLLERESNVGAYSLSKYDLSQYMKLDASAVLALNLIPGPKDGNKNMHLFGLLNRCKTAQGSRLLGQWIKQPLMNLDQIKKRHDFVELFVEDAAVRQGVHGVSLAAFPDLHRLAKKFQRGKANLEDVVRIYQVIRSLPELINTLSQYEGEHKQSLEDKFITPLTELSEKLKNLEQLAETTIDMEAIDHHEYLIKPGINNLTRFFPRASRS
jgi:DNA mismatch repair protein MSH2